MDISGHLVDYTIAAMLWSTVIAYAIFAGADFGGGVWDLFAIGPSSTAQRRAISRAMGPVWEANHVWLIFMITGLFTAFPSAFSLLAVGLYLPFTLVVLGIVMRGASFAFRAHAGGTEGVSPWGVAFGIASAATPFVLGACAGAVASGAVRNVAGPGAGPLFAPWTSPFALVCGGLALAICAGLAAAYLCVEESGMGHPELADAFRHRALVAGAAAGALALAALPLARTAAPRLFDGLTGRALPLTLAAVLAAATAASSMWRRRYGVARIAAATQVLFILSAWAVAQAPYLVPPTITVEGSASPPETMGLLLVAYLAGGALLFPSLYLLFRIFKGRNPRVT
ncbi:MAG: cytochrome d ubiquinol oxidase subunit II [Candidatus Dormibacteria bacterium]